MAIRLLKSVRAGHRTMTLFGCAAVEASVAVRAAHYQPAEKGQQAVSAKMEYLCQHEGTQRIAKAFEKYGENGYIGEPVSQKSHMIQAAMQAEQEFPEDKEVIIAAFLHDIGHLVGLDPKGERERWMLEGVKQA
eukprot:TRINITY_DN8390_c1_g1_i1.p1 TRINITY_DN8390_c1_g1~~TRINITY_DN8390_c1_g1_i1.p1  ORF type:complete len:134 (-),score=31.29 TRINITY_DN8390_c1_g1_i1:107-508(-)